MGDGDVLTKVQLNLVRRLLFERIGGEDRAFQAAVELHGLSED